MAAKKRNRSDRGAELRSQREELARVVLEFIGLRDRSCPERQLRKEVESGILAWNVGLLSAEARGQYQDQMNSVYTNEALEKAVEAIPGLLERMRAISREFDALVARKLLRYSNYRQYIVRHSVEITATQLSLLIEEIRDLPPEPVDLLLNRPPVLPGLS